MTREDQIRVRHRAMLRQRGTPVGIDRDEGRWMAEQFIAGDAVPDIARRHSVTSRQVQRRLYSMDVYQVLPLTRRT